jgi:hypothetical protein
MSLFCPDVINVDLVVRLTSSRDAVSTLCDAMSWLTVGVADAAIALNSGLFVVTHDLPQRGESVKSFVDRVRFLQEQSANDTVARFGAYSCGLVTRYSSYRRQDPSPAVGVQ